MRWFVQNDGKAEKAGKHDKYTINLPFKVSQR